MAPETRAIKAVSTPPGSGPEIGPPRREARARRWLLRGLALSAALLGLAAGGVGILAGQLEHPAIKGRLLALVKESTGLDLDYTGIDLSFRRGLRAQQLRLLTPARFAAHADTFLQIADLDLELSPWALLQAEPRVSALRASSIQVALVRDESGATTLSELFPASDAAQPEAAPLSRTLANLPSAWLEQLDIGAIGVRLVEVASGSATRVVELSGLRLAGSVRSGAAGLEGTRLALDGTPLRAALSEGPRHQHAQLRAELNLRAAAPQTLAFDARAALIAQDILPTWAGPDELLELAGSLRFEAAAGKTTLKLERFQALGETLSVTAQSEVYDAATLRVVSSGNAALHVEALPPELSAVALEGLALELEARELTWDGQQLAGSLTARGGARQLALALPEGSLRLQGAALSAAGSFDPARSNLQATLSASTLAARTPGGDVDLDALELELEGAASGGDTTRVGSTRAKLAAGAVRLSGAAPALTLERLALSASAQDLAPDAGAPFGVKGSAQLALSVPALSAFDGAAARGARRRPSATLAGLELRAQLPLSLANVTGSLAAAALNAPAAALRDLRFEFDLREPLAWSAAGGDPAATLTGRIGRVDAGGGRAALGALRLFARRAEPDRYQLELSATGDALSARGVAVPGRVQAEARADAAPAAGTLRLTTELSGERDAAVALELDLGFERPSERLRYRAALSAQRLGAFAAFVSGLAPGAAPLSLERAGLRASAHGELSGVLHASAGDLPALVARPLAALRGSQGMSVELQGIEYRSQSRSLAIPELSVQLDSVHGAGGAGSLNASLRAGSIELGSAGSSLRTSGLHQQLRATFERAPDEARIDVRSTLALGELRQSWLPEYPMRDVQLSSQLQIERLRSIVVRELRLENAAAGTVLQASGALELDPKASPARGTIPARQALALVGRLEQPLAPLEASGFAARARGTLAVPFRLESGGLLAYRLLAALEARDVSFTNAARSLEVQGLNGVIPLIEEFVLLPTGLELSPGPRTSPLADPRFFDLHPFLSSNNYVTAEAITVGQLQPLGPIAANVRVDRTDFLIDQLQAGFRGGQIVGRLHTAYRQGDPIVRLRLNATGLRTSSSGDVLDANLALTFVPRAMTLDGKIQLVRASRAHVMDILDVLDPYHELVTANRVRSALALGYPKFVRFQLHDGAVDSKLELGGLANLVRIDEIRAVPLGPILQRYVAPTAATFITPRAPAAPAPQALAEPAQELSP